MKIAIAPSMIPQDVKKKLANSPSISNFLSFRTIVQIARQISGRLLFSANLLSFTAKYKPQTTYNF